MGHTLHFCCVVADSSPVVSRDREDMREKDVRGGRWEEMGRRKKGILPVVPFVALPS